MDGWPVWLASTSLRDRHGRIVGTEKWSAEQMTVAQAGLDTLLDGIGNRESERSFRMCITLCRHRALTSAEADRLPESWWTEPARDLAGGPVEVLWSRGITETLSTQPCANPIRRPMSPGLYFPEDCGKCESCVARATCRAKIPARPTPTGQAGAVS